MNFTWRKVDVLSSKHLSRHRKVLLPYKFTACLPVRLIISHVVANKKKLFFFCFFFEALHNDPDSSLPWESKTFPATWHMSPGSHRAASVHRLIDAKLSDIQNLLMFLSGKLSDNLTHCHPCNERLSVSLNTASSSACFTMPWKKCEQSSFISAVSKSRSAGYWQLFSFSLFFEKKKKKKPTDFLHVVPASDWTSRPRPETLLFSTDTAQALNLDTYHSPLLLKIIMIKKKKKIACSWVS